MTQLILSFSEDSEICIYQSSDESYIIQFLDDREIEYETLEELYEGLTLLDLRGVMIPCSAFHDIEVLMANENAFGKLEKPFNFEKGEENE